MISLKREHRRRGKEVIKYIKTIHAIAPVFKKNEGEKQVKNKMAM